MSSIQNKFKISLVDSAGASIDYATCSFVVDSWYGTKINQTLGPYLNPNTNYYELDSGVETVWSIGDDRYPKSITIKEIKMSNYKITCNNPTSTEIVYWSAADQLSRTGTVQFVCTKTTSSGSLILKPFRAYIYVQDQDGAPISGVTCTFKWKNATKDSTATSNDNGIITIHDSMGNEPQFNWTLTKDGYDTVSERISPINTTTIVKTMVRNSLIITGTVYDYGTRSVASGVKVKAYVPNDSSIAQTVTTDTNGKYSITISDYPKNKELFVGLDPSVLSSTSVVARVAYSYYLSELYNSIERNILIDTSKTLVFANLKNEWIPFKEFLVAQYSQAVESVPGNPWRCLSYSSIKDKLPISGVANNSLPKYSLVKDSRTVCSIKNGESSNYLVYRSLEDNFISGRLAAGSSVNVPTNYTIEYYFEDSNYNKQSNVLTEKINVNKTFKMNSGSYYGQLGVIIYNRISDLNVRVGVSNDSSKLPDDYILLPKLGSGQVNMKKDVSGLFVDRMASYGTKWCLSSSPYVSDRFSYTPARYPNDANRYYIAISYEQVLSADGKIFVLETS